MRYISSTKYESGIFKYYASWGTGVLILKCAQSERSARYRGKDLVSYLVSLVMFTAGESQYKCMLRGQMSRFTASHAFPHVGSTGSVATCISILTPRAHGATIYRQHQPPPLIHIISSRNEKFKR
ncbi:hypothetical protein H112_07879 [Trichophyton rubrum D6]|uniref:Uncharacterized protein n=2 Tax=Trichophyton TaxID=5550 RepID=A0A022VQU1_TRIRU|nr:hypothetical protein H100_07906 [Trichophyton rubrum MR850]EZF37842.1 hypothetical protein H102_07866 [Trichophyton rubrum CBS 100081]EZF48406.1 hypothetical protein H103_07891 [Trichophyton rubrum CBS 288.86]EZF59103.1 hypothetical protein H104_07838 [Trichophyton rubrum CBS 289.86]EZF69659.1 hypothetical protein H105_07892 [Trichophyton soudanense CBS 452.61]EZF80365.1 hypothetical protein H110_07890 [Trichophyton rubrum MR1448]EZF90984.1 hypothetical protein H113_07951 [Trichophyton rub